MGRLKKSKENKATGESISLTPKHRQKLYELEKILGKCKSTIIQDFIEEKYEKIMKQGD